MRLLLVMSTITLLLAVGLPAVQGASMILPDYTKLHLQGNGMKQDSFSLSVVAAAKLLGREVDYRTVHCLSTNAFSPAIDPGEDCMSWWHVEASMSTKKLAIITARVGLEAKKLDVPQMKDWQESDADREQRLQTTAKVIRQALDAGAVVIIDGGWDFKDKNGFVPWGWAGVITGATPEGVITGATLNGKTDNRYIYNANMWALTPGKVTLTPHEADLAMLTATTQRIRGEGEFKTEKRGVYGTAAMDLWIKQMQTAYGFCAHCRESQNWDCVSDGTDNAITTTEGAKDAAAYLRQIAPDFPRPARQQLLNAASRYDRIVTLLAPFTTTDKDKGYYQVKGLAAQQAHAKAVLYPIKEELNAIANNCNIAVAADEVIPGQVRPDTLPTLADVPDDGGGTIPYGSAGVPNGIVAAFNFAGVKVGYSEFIASTGWAFSFGYKYNDISPASLAVEGNPNEDGPYAMFRYTTQWLGYRYDGVPVKDEEKFWAFVTKNVDAGTPVLCEQFDGGLITGYRTKDGARQVWFDGWVGGGWTDIKKMQPAWVYILVKQGEPLSRRELYLRALRRAVTVAEAPRWRNIP
ncbi:MAG: hypothetical protein WCJ56_09755, partial [bacterium]